jgi:hypothetical protein
MSHLTCYSRLFIEKIEFFGDFGGFSLFLVALGSL